MKLTKLFILLFFLSCITKAPAQNVYITDTGKKYHKSNCRYLKYSKKEISLEKALERNLTACKVCKPKNNNTSKKVKADSNPSSTKKKSTSTSKSIASQCTGKTKSGARCKRKTKSASGRCYQH